MLKGRKAYDFINNYLKDSKFSDTKIPLQIIATNLANGEEVIISKGSIAKAAQASTCVPGIFPPVKINNRYLVDGGVVNPTPVDTVENMGADIVIGVDLMLKREIKLTRKPNLVTTLLQSYEIIREQAVKLNLEKVSGDVILIKPKVKGAIESFKFYDIGKFIKAGEKATQAVLPEIRSRLK